MDAPEDNTPTPCPPEETFTALLEGTLSTQDRAQLDIHLDQCADCAQLVADLAGLIDTAAPSADADPPIPLAPPQSEDKMVIGGRYAILRMVGRGGMGSVYEAFDDSLGRKVAIKVLRSDLVEADRREEHSARLQREARLLAAVHHPNVLSVYDVGTWNDQVFMAIQYVEGTTLREWIKFRKPDWREILEVYLKIGDGLAEAHRLGLVHRDIKPDNVLLDHNGRAWLADFGLACAIGSHVAIDGEEGDEEEDDASGEEALLYSAVTRTGAIVGTPAYMAPEQHMGLETDERTDQFSFAASLFESLYGTRAYAGRTRLALKDAVCEGAVKLEPAGPVPRGMYRVILKALAPNPDARHESLPRFLAALRHAATARPLWRQILRVTAVVTLAGVSLVGIASTALVLLAIFSNDPPAPQDEETAGLTDAELDAMVKDIEPDPPKPLTSKEREALEIAAFKKKNEACRADSAACKSLSDELAGCCLSSEYEGISSQYEARYKAGSDGLAEQFDALCDSGDAVACVHAALSYVFSFHRYSIPEGSLVPRYVERMRRACEGGQFIGCATMQDTYADGGYNNEGEFSIAANGETLVEILERSCSAGYPRACWIIAESFFKATAFERISEPRRDKRALTYVERACEGGWAQACLIGGLARRDLEHKPCTLNIKPLLGKIPENDLFDYTASWSDVANFCKRFAHVADGAKSRAYFERGCAASNDDTDATTRAIQKKSIALSCTQLNLLKNSDSDDVEK